MKNFFIFDLMSVPQCTNQRRISEPIDIDYFDGL